MKKNYIFTLLTICFFALIIELFCFIFYIYKDKKNFENYLSLVSQFSYYKYYDDIKMVMPEPKKNFIHYTPEGFLKSGF